MRCSTFAPFSVVLTLWEFNVAMQNPNFFWGSRVAFGGYKCANFGLWILGKSSKGPCLTSPLVTCRFWLKSYDMRTKMEDVSAHIRGSLDKKLLNISENVWWCWVICSLKNLAAAMFGLVIFHDPWLCIWISRILAKARRNIYQISIPFRRVHDCMVKSIRRHRNHCRVVNIRTCTGGAGTGRGSTKWKEEGGHVSVQQRNSKLRQGLLYALSTSELGA